MHLLAVNYHYFRESKPTNGIYPLSRQELSHQIDVLSRYYTFISQDDVINLINSKQYTSKKYCLLTFDDGLKEQMNALDLLNQKGIPGVFYITTNSIRKTKVVSVHKLHYIRSVMEDSQVFKFINSRINTSTIKYPSNIGELYRYDDIETKKLKYLLNFILETEMKNTLIDELFDEVADEEEFSKKLYMEIKDIKNLNNLGYLGTHSDLHLPLATLSGDEVKNDISNSLDFFKKSCGIDHVKSISYPYGGQKAVSQKVVDVASQFEFEFGLTMFRGINTLTEMNNPLLLKRIDTNDAPGGKLASKEFCL